MSELLDADGRPTRAIAPATGFRRQAVFAGFVLFGLVVVVAASWTLRSLLLLTFLSILLAVLLRSAAEWITRRTTLGAGWAVLGVLLGLVVLLVLAFVLVVPTLVLQGTELVRSFPTLLGTFEQRVSNTPFLSKAWDQIRQQFDLPSPSAALSQVGNVLGFLSESVSNVVFILFATIFLALSPATYVGGLVRMVPVRHRPFTEALLAELGGTLRAWFGGQLVMMAMVGVLVWLGLWAIGVPYSLALGALAGLLEFVPYLGPVLGAAPAIIIGFAASPTTGLWALGLFIVIGQIEGNIVGPKIQEAAVEVPPALLLITLFGMGQVFGITGLVVATPLLAVLIVMVRRIYVEHILEGSTADPVPR